MQVTLRVFEQNFNRILDHNTLILFLHQKNLILDIVVLLWNISISKDIHLIFLHHLNVLYIKPLRDKIGISH